MAAISTVSLILGVDCFAVGDVRRPFVGDQRKGRIRRAVPGHGHGRRDARVHRSGCGKGASTDGACDRGHGEETAPSRIAWREHHGASIADVFVGGVIYTLSAWVIWIASFVARV